ncbi:MAG TPA: hypothetical protein VN109_02925 [Devosia sp.]|mgnify:CR=1 FL=1|jgi:hypothetical protein|nr:hypothetical protein [Devosia sp.]
MTDLQDMPVTPQHFAPNISRWHEEASRLRTRSRQETSPSTKSLVHLERFDATVVVVAKQSPPAAEELAEVGERLCSTRSAPIEQEPAH